MLSLKKGLNCQLQSEVVVCMNSWLQLNCNWILLPKVPKILSRFVLLCTYVRIVLLCMYSSTESTFWKFFSSFRLKNCFQNCGQYWHIFSLKFAGSQLGWPLHCPNFERGSLPSSSARPGKISYHRQLNQLFTRRVCWPPICCFYCRKIVLLNALKEWPRSKKEQIWVKKERLVIVCLYSVWRAPYKGIEKVRN